MRKKLSLYVWKGVLADYTDGFAFAIAYDVEEARDLATKDMPYARNGLSGEPEILPIAPYGFAIYGGG